MQDIINRCNNERKKEKEKYEEEIQMLQDRLSVAVSKELQFTEQNKILQEVIDVRQKKRKVSSEQGNLQRKSYTEAVLGETDADDGSEETDDENITKARQNSDKRQTNTESDDIEWKSVGYERKK